MNRPAQNTKHSLLANSAWIFAIRFFPALASLLMVVWFSRQLNAGFYGMYQQFWVQLQIGMAIAGLGIPALFLTYPPDKISTLLSRLKAAYLAAIIAWLVLCGYVFSLFQFRDAGTNLHLFSWTFLISGSLSAIGESYLMSGKRFGLIALGSLVYAIAFIALHWLFVTHAIDLRQLLYSLLAASVVKLLLILGNAWSLHRSLVIIANRPDSVRNLWIHLGIYDVIQVLFRWGDKFILSFFLSKELFAVYFNGTIEIPFLALMLGAVGSALLLHLNKQDTTDDGRIHLLKKSSAMLSLIVLPVFFFFAIYRNEVFSVAFNNRYNDAANLFLITCLVIPLRAYNFTSILQNKDKGRVINMGAVIDLIVAMGLLFPLYKIWGLKGVALASVISTYVQAGYYLWQTARTLDCRITDLLPIQQWLIYATVFLAGYIGLYYISSLLLNSWYTLILGGSVTLVIILMVLSRALLRNRK